MSEKERLIQEMDEIAKKQGESVFKMTTTKMTLTDYLTKLKKLESEATLGPWQVKKYPAYDGRPSQKKEHWITKPGGMYVADVQDYDKTVDFIAESRTAIPKLIKIIERYREALELAKEACYDGYLEIKLEGESDKECVIKHLKESYDLALAVLSGEIN